MRNTTAEPVITRAGVAAVIVAVCTIAGVTVDAGLVDVIAGVIAVLAPLVAGYFARKRVSPVSAQPTGNGLEEPQHRAA